MIEILSEEQVNEIINQRKKDFPHPSLCGEPKEFSILTPEGFGLLVKPYEVWKLNHKGLCSSWDYSGGEFLAFSKEYNFIANPTLIDLNATENKYALLKLLSRAYKDLNYMFFSSREDIRKELIRLHQSNDDN